jgi:NAD(P)-dependent dehydrogenase (short-subunit alcohol dehydrogenase family)
MTGGTSGLGAVALEQLARQPGTRVLLGARGPKPAGTENLPVQTLPLDLAKLDSVRAFAAAVIDRLAGAGIDSLVLNAGVNMHDGKSRTADGFETTFGVNHLAHYLLLRLLMPHLASGAVVVLTTSATHDPAAKTILPVPRHADARLLAHPEQDPQRDEKARAAAGRAYSSSKLCNILTARALAAQPEAVAGNWRVLAYDPGPTGGTNLMRNTPPAMRMLWKLLGTSARALMPHFNSRAAAGGNLAGLAGGRIIPPTGQWHARVVKNELTWPRPSELALSDEARDALWRDSAPLVGLPSTTPAGS